MNTVAIDKNALDMLFDNQKKLDRLFDSVFDDEKYFITATSYQAPSRYPDFDFDDPSMMYGGSKVKESMVTIRQNPAYMLLLIVLEIALIYWVATKLF